MIVADVNLLVYAYRLESDRHDRAAAWLAETLSGGDDVALIDVVLSGFLRIVTNAKIFADPAPASHALDFVETIVSATRSRWVAASPSAWRKMRELVSSDRGLRGNLIPDAFLAAVTISQGARLATCDRGFARFPGLEWFDPLSGRAWR
ncbi:MAG: putative PIN domain nucleic acid-binding protein [Acidimicrobiaceae bacterium]|nr:MAG: putative PIN domain nucleic acid-binding protein [Acidimicrobiaceae bacterium]